MLRVCECCIPECVARAFSALTHTIPEIVANIPTWVFPFFLSINNGFLRTSNSGRAEVDTHLLFSVVETINNKCSLVGVSEAFIIVRIMETQNKRKVYTTPLLHIRMVKPCTMLAASDPTGNIDPWNSGEQTTGQVDPRN